MFARQAAQDVLFMRRANSEQFFTPAKMEEAIEKMGNSSMTEREIFNAVLKKVRQGLEDRNAAQIGRGKDG